MKRGRNQRNIGKKMKTKEKEVFSHSQIIITGIQSLIFRIGTLLITNYSPVSN